MVSSSLKVPPYTLSVSITWSPDESNCITDVMADNPDDYEIASSPFSKEHMFSSKLVRVGFPALE